MPRYIDVISCRHAGTLVTTVKRIDYRQSHTPIRGAGDGDKTETFRAKGKKSVTGTIVLEDPVQAAALKAAAGGDLIFKASEGNDLTKRVIVTIKGVSFFRLSGSHVHDDIHGVQVGFRGFAAAGTALVTVAAETGVFTP